MTSILPPRNLEWPPNLSLYWLRETWRSTRDLLKPAAPRSSSAFRVPPLQPTVSIWGRALWQPATGFVPDIQAYPLHANKSYIQTRSWTMTSIRKGCGLRISWWWGGWETPLVRADWTLKSKDKGDCTVARAYYGKATAKTYEYNE